VLGIDAGQSYDEVVEVLAPGATLVLYTDGLVEARRGGELYGSERLDAVLAEHHGEPAEELARAVMADCRAWSGGELADDCALVLIKRSSGVDG
jgi:sigma-B regulation protein RsbU (phosphoserine phosphatase)